MLCYPLTIFKKYKFISKERLLTIDQYLSSAEFTKEEFCLILRPFGADGMLYLHSDGTPGLRLFRIGYPTVTVEEILTDIVKTELDVRTVGVADPELSALSPGSLYLEASDTWRNDVENLVERALLVVFIFPPNQHSTNNVNWELLAVARKGMLNRALVVLPSLSQANGENIRQCIDSISRVVPGFSEQLHERLLVSHLALNGFRMWYEGGIGRGTQEQTYRRILTEAVQRIKLEVTGKTFLERYPYHLQRGKRALWRSEVVRADYRPEIERF